MEDQTEQQLREQFRADLAALIVQPRYQAIGFFPLVQELLTLLATMMVDGVHFDPTMHPTFLLCCDQLREYVAAVGPTPPASH